MHAPSMSVLSYSDSRCTRIIKGAAQLLKLPHAAAATALVLLHKYRRALAEPQHTDITLVAACLLLASKIEEVPVKSVDLFNALKSCQAAEEGHIVGDGGSTATIADVIVGPEYAAVKHQVHLSEQVLLREIGFDIGVKHPHRYLLNIGKTMGYSRAAMQLAVYLANDSLVFTDLCLKYTAPEVAAGCLTVAVCIEGKSKQQSINKVPQLGCLGLSQTRVDAVGHILVQMIESVPV